uniref:Metal transporter CNNM4 n=1 Tax=Aceria tosichella TaxID=561515 RepID=A0A6G1SP49_9ACAR
MLFILNLLELSLSSSSSSGTSNELLQQAITNETQHNVQAYNHTFVAAAADENCTCNKVPKEPPSDLVIGLQYGGIVVLIFLSALFSGLVLGLLSLDVTELEILRKCGTEKERQYANTIIPMRRNSNLLLCSLVIGNVVVNSGLQWLLDSVFNGLIGFLISTICITIFGEIVPQAVCARYGLAIGAKTVWITWIVIVLTFPVAYPLSVVLDVVLGEEIAFIYDRERLQEYMKITRNYNNFDAQEVNIITGALKIKKVAVSHVMTKLKDVFMLPIETIINYQTITTIIKRGFSRVPVYERSRRNLIGVLMVKDLALVNPHVDVTLKSLIQFYKHPLILVDETHTLDIVFNHFREGKSHMAFVREHRRKDIIGIVTLEDIIEEVLQVEINDETDIVTDNRELRLRPDAQIPPDLDQLHVHLADAIARRRAKERQATIQQVVARTANKAPQGLPNPQGTRSSSRTKKSNRQAHDQHTIS